MIIVHVSTQESWGGGEKQVFYLMTELRKKNVEQILICSQSSSLAQKAKAASFKVTELKKTPLLPLQWSSEIAKFVKQNPGSILHAHDGKAHNCLLMHALVNPHVPIIVHRRVVKEKRGAYSKYKFNHPSIRKIVCISTAVLQSLEPIITDKSKLLLIPSGIKLECKTVSEYSKELVKKHFGIPKDSKLILNIGSLLEQKQQMFFLKVARAFFAKDPKRKESYFFAILGEGPLHEQLEEFIAQSDLKKNCLMLGFSKQVHEILSTANVLVSCSIDEALGNVVMEAFLAEVPVVASDSGGVIDLIKDGETGLLANPLNEASFLESCEELLNNAEFTKKITTAARKKLDDFNIEKTAESLYRLYLSIQPEP